jgi:hypothetical protein
MAGHPEGGEAWLVVHLQIEFTSHPAEWEMGGYNEIQSPPKRYGLIDLPCLRGLCGYSNPAHFTEQ